MNTLKIKVSNICQVSYAELTICNLITQRSFKVSRSVIDSFVYFKDKVFTISDFESYCMSIEDASNVSTVVKKLLDNNILIEENYEETTVIVSHPIPLLRSSKNPNINNIKEHIIVIGFPYGNGNPISTKVSEFPSKIRLFCKNINIESIVRMEICSKQTSKMVDVGDLYIYDMELPNIALLKIQQICKKIINGDNRMLSLGGDHSITLPIIEAYSNYYDNIIIIQLDAHTDRYRSQLHSVYQKKGYTYTHHGNFMTQIHKIDKIDSIITFGIRGNTNIAMHSNQIDKVENYFYLNDLICRIKNIPNSVPIYVTVDIDFFDSALAPATSTPEIFGFSYDIFREITDVLNNKYIIGADLMEINPSMDISDRTMQLSSKIIIELLKILHHEI